MTSAAFDPRRFWVLRPALACLGAAVAVLLAGCDWRSSATDEPGWYLHKTGETTATIIHVNSRLERQEWEGTLADDSVRSSGLKTIKPSEAQGVFRFSRPGCAELTFVLTRQSLKCTTCMQPTQLVADSGTCDHDQMRLPVEGWQPIRVPLPN